MPGTEVHCEYLKPALYDQTVVVNTRIRHFKGVRFGLDYEIKDEASGQLLARCYTLHGFVDKDLKPINIKKKNPEVYRIIMDAMEERA